MPRCVVRASAAAGGVPSGTNSSEPGRENMRTKRNTGWHGFASAWLGGDAVEQHIHELSG
jgi:hypothetical protein